MTAPRRAHRLVAAVALLAATGALGACAEPFQPQGSQARAARDAAAGVVQQVLGDLAAGRPPVATARFDQCASGQDTWKRRDEHAHECTLASSALLPLAARRDELSPALLRLHEQLSGLGCAASSGDGLADIERTYWRPHLLDRSPPATALPDAVYRCGDAPDLVEVEVQPLPPGADAGARRAALEPDVLLSSYAPDLVLVDEPFAPTAEAALASSGEHSHAVVTASRLYYATDF